MLGYSRPVNETYLSNQRPNQKFSSPTSRLLSWMCIYCYSFPSCNSSPNRYFALNSNLALSSSSLSHFRVLSPVSVSPEVQRNTTRMAEVEREVAQTEHSDERKNMNYPLVRYSEVPEDTKAEILDTITGAVERYFPDLEMACRSIKEEMDRLYDPHWHVVIGESFGFEVTNQTQNIMYLFFMGNLGILVWKCS